MTERKGQMFGETAAFDELHHGLTVSLISTKRGELKTCQRDETVEAVRSRTEENYDYFPVMDNESRDARIVGLFKTSADAPGSTRIRDHTIALSDDNLIGANASILDFLTDIDSKPIRLTVSGTAIDGLVSWADLQKLPVRAALFGLITGFEMIMTDAIRHMYPKDDDWLDLMSCGRRKKVKDEIETARKNNSEVDSLLYTQISDKADILRKFCNLGESNTKLKAHFSRIRDLRDNLAHANDYASNLEVAKQLCRTVKKLLELRKKIEEQVHS